MTRLAISNRSPPFSFLETPSKLDGVFLFFFRLADARSRRDEPPGAALGQIIFSSACTDSCVHGLTARRIRPITIAASARFLGPL
jgi:hypothetical protein